MYIYAVIYIYLISYSISVYLQIWSLDEMVIRVYHHYSTFIVPCFLLPSKTTFWASTLVGLVLNKTRSLSLCLLVESQVVSLDWFKGKNIGTPLYWMVKKPGFPPENQSNWTSYLMMESSFLVFKSPGSNGEAIDQLSRPCLRSVIRHLSGGVLEGTSAWRAYRGAQPKNAGVIWVWKWLHVTENDDQPGGWIGVVPKFSHGAIICWLENHPTWEPLALKSLNHWSGSDS